MAGQSHLSPYTAQIWGQTGSQDLQGQTVGITAPTWQLQTRVLVFCLHGRTQPLQRELFVGCPGWLRCFGHASALQILVLGRDADRLVSCLAVDGPRRCLCDLLSLFALL